MSNDKVNEAIRILKDLCKSKEACEECPMNMNCFDSPFNWDEVEDHDVQ